MTLLSESADRDGPAGAPVRAGELSSRPGAPVGITRVVYPGNGSTRLMRVMQTNACSLSSGYCPTFCGGKVRRTYLAPEEVSRVFMDAHRSGLADGLFLTSGVPGRPAKMTDRMLATVDLLRRREGFRGYVHLKLLPGAESAQVEAAVRLASRVSINLEAPGDGYVRALAREKDFGGDLRRSHLLALGLDPGVAVVSLDDLVRHHLDVALDDFVLEAATDEALDREHGVLRIGHGLALGGLADQHLAVLGKRDDGRRGAITLAVLDDARLAAFHDGDAGIGGSQIDADYLSHTKAPLFDIEKP